MCAAPANSFRQKTLKQTKGSTTLDCLIAIPNATEAVLKQRFYLDVLLAVDEYDASGNRIAGFIGGCVVGSQNHGMHNSNRIFTLKGTQGVNGQIDFFNDAGLNTLGKITNPLGTNEMPDIVNDEIGTLEVEARFRSAWWVNTSKQGFEWKVPGFANSTNNLGTQAMATDIVHQYLMSENDQWYHKAGDLLEIRAYVENAEGTFYSNWKSVTVKPRQLVMKYNVQYASSAYNGTVTRTVYVGTPALRVGTKIYSSQAMAEADLPPAGYYTYGEEWFKVESRTVNNVTSMEIVAMGAASASGWPTGDPAYDSGARIMQRAFYNANSFADPCDRYNQGFLPNVTIWKNTIANERYFTQEVGGEEVANGWYVWGGIWHQLVGGYVVSTGSCPVGG